MQLKSLRKQIFDTFEKDCIRRPSSSKEQVVENFAKITETGYEEALNRFTKLSDRLVPDGSGWGSHVLSEQAELAQ